MSRKPKPQTCIIASIAFAMAVIAGVKPILADKLEPTGPPGPTMHTLSEIYSKVADLEPADPTEFPMGSDIVGSSIIHASVVGEIQGLIEGSSEVADREGSILLVGFSSGIDVPTDAGSGIPTGKRQHRPITISKLLDKSTPKLLQACVSGENLPSVSFDFYRLDSGGKEQHYYTILLENARITSYSHTGANSESLSFTYQKITWVWEDGAITAEDDWETPTV